MRCAGAVRRNDVRHGELIAMRWFEIALVVLTLFTGIVWLLDKLFLAKRRAARAGLLDAKEPVVVDYSQGVLPGAGGGAGACAASSPNRSGSRPVR